MMATGIGHAASCGNAGGDLRQLVFDRMKHFHTSLSCCRLSSTNLATRAVFVKGAFELATLQREAAETYVMATLFFWSGLWYTYRRNDYLRSLIVNL